MRPIASALLASLLVANLVGCKEDPKPTTSTSATPKKPEAVPQDFVINDFLGDAAGSEPSAATRGDGEAPRGEAARAERPLKVLEPGAEPRAPKRYSFAKGKMDTRAATFRMGLSQEAPGAPPQSQNQPPLKVTLMFGAKDEAPNTRFMAKIAKIELADAKGIDPRQKAEADKMFGTLAGIDVTFVATPRGAVRDLSFPNDPRVEQAGEILPVFQQAFEYALPPFPEEAIGVGARWEDLNEMKDQGVKATVTTTYTLKEWNGDAGVVVADVKRAAPKQQVNDPRMPPGTMIELEGKGTYTFQVKLDRISSKVDGDLATVVKIEARDPRAPMKPPQMMKQTIKMQQSLETPK